MPVINTSSKNEMLSKFKPMEPDNSGNPSFGEVFDASLGYVIDEELSISTLMNREGWRERAQRIDQMVESGEIPNVEKYRYDWGGTSKSLNYDRIAKDLGRDDIKTDETLTKERNELLESRRQYKESIVSRGSGAAQFLGAMNAYMMDPVNILTMGIAAPSVTAKSVGNMGRIFMASKNAALIEGATELGIQAFVYQHKQDIDSPYSARDALANIAMAAIGAGAIGGVTEGISGWLKKTLKHADKLEETEELLDAKKYLRRQEETLKGAPKANHETVKAEFLNQTRVKLQSEIDNLKAAGSEFKPQLRKLQSDLKSINKEKIPRTLQINFKQELHKAQVDIDQKYLQEMHDRSKQYALPTKDQSIYQKPFEAEEIKPKAVPASASQREKEILRAQGLDEIYDQEYAKYNQLESKKMLVDDELIDSDSVVKQYDDEISGLDSVLTCAYGSAPSGAGDSKLVSAFVGAFNAK